VKNTNPTLQLLHAYRRTVEPIFFNGRCTWIRTRRIILRILILLTYIFNPWSTVRLKKLAGYQLVKKFPTFYATRKFITAYTSARQLSLSCGRSIPSTPLHPTSWRSILILSSHLRLGLPSGLFPLKHPQQNPVYTSALPIVLHALPISFFSISSPERYWVRSTDHEAPHCTTTATTLLLLLLLLLIVIRQPLW
jgi:hypothetical protein